MKSLQWLLSALSALVLATTILGQSAPAPAGGVIVGGNVSSFFGFGGVAKGAPFSADIVHEFTQVLADGNRIHRESQGKIFRDAEGRNRSEVEDEMIGGTATPRITIHDPVAQTFITLYPQTKTAIVNHTNVYRDASGRGIGVGSGTGSGVVTDATGRRIGIGASAGNGAVTGAQTPEELLAKLKALQGSQGDVQITKRSTQMSSEQLGKKEIEGFIASGNRHSRTIPAGEIGNEKPIVSSTETWFCEDLKTTLLSVTDDPQTGQRITRLTNIRVGDPDPQLFQIPPDYTVKDNSPKEKQ
jgi:hypothetical protein